MARPRFPRKKAADAAYHEVGQAVQLALLVAGGSASGAAMLGRAGFARLATLSPQVLERPAMEAVEKVAESVK
jgi:hypothetical protein